MCNNTDLLQPKLFKKNFNHGLVLGMINLIYELGLPSNYARKFKFICWINMHEEGLENN